jgi:transposase
MARSSNREQWRKRVQRWRDSGLSAREYAALTGLNLHTLKYWSCRLRGEKKNDSAAAMVVATKPRFIEVTEALTGVRTVAEDSGLELRVSDVVIRVETQFDERTLGRVLAVVRQR